MKNNVFLTISLLIAFSCCAQNSIRKDNDYFNEKSSPFALLDANLKEELLKLGKKRAKIQFNDQFVILDTTHT